MAEQDYAAIGRIVSERKELNEKIDQIRAELTKHADVLRQLASGLSSHQERVVFTGQSTTGIRSSQGAPQFSVSDDLIPHLKQSVSGLRDELQKLAEVERKASHLGV